MRIDKVRHQRACKADVHVNPLKVFKGLFPKTKTSRETSSGVCAPFSPLSSSHVSDVIKKCLCQQASNKAALLSIKIPYKNIEHIEVCYTFNFLSMLQDVKYCSQMPKGVFSCFSYNFTYY